MLSVICVIIAVLGLILILLSVLPYTATYAPHGVPAGIALVVVGVILYIVLALFAHPASTYDNPSDSPPHSGYALLSGVAGAGCADTPTGSVARTSTAEQRRAGTPGHGQVY